MSERKPFTQADAEMGTAEQNEQVSRTLNNMRAERLPQRVPYVPCVIWWEPIGAMCFRLKNYNTLNVIGSIRRVVGFHGFRWEARVNGTGHTTEFESAMLASGWVEEHAND